MTLGSIVFCLILSVYWIDGDFIASDILILLYLRVITPQAPGDISGGVTSFDVNFSLVHVSKQY